GLYLERDSLAAARQPRTLAAGDGNLPPLRRAPYRTDEPEGAGNPRQPVDEASSAHADGHHAHARSMGEAHNGERHRDRHDADAASGLSPAQSGAQEARMARFPCREDASRRARLKRGANEKSGSSPTPWR